MKIRNDFVSNSSSSSFIISIDFNKYDFDLFAKTVCDNCDDKTNSDPDVRKRNDAVIRYCLQFNELLFLGTLIDGRKTQIFKRGYSYSGEKETDPNQLKHTPFQQLYDEYMKYGKNHVYDNHDHMITLIDNDTIQEEYDNEAGEDLVVLHQYMENYIRDKYTCEESEEINRQKRVDKILNIVRRESKDDYGWMSPYFANTYKITLNTIENTRDLLASGFKIQFRKWQKNMNALEARIKAGETIFYTECGDSGEGEDDTRLYSLNSQFPFDGVPFETIGSEY